jgi:hypothetical protein
LQQHGAASQPQLGAGAAQHGAGAGALQHGAGAGAAQQGAGAGAAQQGAGAGAAQQGAGAGAAQHFGAGASHPQLGATSQQLECNRLCILASTPLILQPNCSLGRQTGAQHGAGAGASQQTGAESQQAFFLQKMPAEASAEENAAQTTTDREMINRRMELTPKLSKSFVNRAVNCLISKPIRGPFSCHLVSMAVDAKSDGKAFPPKTRKATQSVDFAQKF